MKLFPVTMFGVKLLIAQWMLDVFIAAEFPDSILIMPYTLFPGVISECALFSYICFLNVPLHELQRHT